MHSTMLFMKTQSILINGTDQSKSTLVFPYSFLSLPITAPPSPKTSMKGARRTRKTPRSDGGGFADLMKPPHPTTGIHGVITGVARTPDSNSQQQPHHLPSSSVPRSSGSLSISTRSPISPSSPLPQEDDWGTLLNEPSRPRKTSTTVSPTSKSNSLSASVNPSPSRRSPSEKVRQRPRSFPTSYSNAPPKSEPIVNMSKKEPSTTSNVPAFLSGWDGAQGWADDPSLDDSDHDLDNIPDDVEDAWGAWAIPDDIPDVTENVKQEPIQQKPADDIQLHHSIATTSQTLSQQPSNNAENLAADPTLAVDEHTNTFGNSSQSFSETQHMKIEAVQVSIMEAPVNVSVKEETISSALVPEQAQTSVKSDPIQTAPVVDAFATWDAPTETDVQESDSAWPDMNDVTDALPQTDSNVENREPPVTEAIAPTNTVATPAEEKATTTTIPEFSAWDASTDANDPENKSVWPDMGDVATALPQARADVENDSTSYTETHVTTSVTTTFVQETTTTASTVPEVSAWNESVSTHVQESESVWPDMGVVAAALPSAEVEIENNSKPLTGVYASTETITVTSQERSTAAGGDSEASAWNASTVVERQQASTEPEQTTSAPAVDGFAAWDAPVDSDPQESDGAWPDMDDVTVVFPQTGADIESNARPLTAVDAPKTTVTALPQEAPVTETTIPQESEWGRFEDEASKEPPTDSQSGAAWPGAYTLAQEAVALPPPAELETSQSTLIGSTPYAPEQTPQSQHQTNSNAWESFPQNDSAWSQTQEPATQLNTEQDNVKDPFAPTDVNATEQTPPSANTQQDPWGRFDDEAAWPPVPASDGVEAPPPPPADLESSFQVQTETTAVSSASVEVTSDAPDSSTGGNVVGDSFALPQNSTELSKTNEFGLDMNAHEITIEQTQSSALSTGEVTVIAQPLAQQHEAPPSATNVSGWSASQTPNPPPTDSNWSNPSIKTEKPSLSTETAPWSQSDSSNINPWSAPSAPNPTWPQPSMAGEKVPITTSAIDRSQTDLSGNAPWTDHPAQEAVWPATTEQQNPWPDSVQDSAWNESKSAPQAPEWSATTQQQPQEPVIPQTNASPVGQMTPWDASDNNNVTPKAETSNDTEPGQSATIESGGINSSTTIPANAAPVEQDVDQGTDHGQSISMGFSGWPTQESQAPRSGHSVENQSFSAAPYAPSQTPGYAPQNTQQVLEEPDNVAKYAPRVILSPQAPPPFPETQIGEQQQTEQESNVGPWSNPTNSHIDETNQVSYSQQGQNLSAGWGWGEPVEAPTNNQQQPQYNANPNQWSDQNSFQHTQDNSNLENKWSYGADNHQGNDGWGWEPSQPPSSTAPSNQIPPPSEVSQTQQPVSSQFVNEWGFNADTKEADNSAWGWEEESENPAQANKNISDHAYSQDTSQVTQTNHNLQPQPLPGSRENADLVFSSAPQAITQTFENAVPPPPPMDATAGQVPEPQVNTVSPYSSVNQPTSSVGIGYPSVEAPSYGRTVSSSDNQNTSSYVLGANEMAEMGNGPGKEVLQEDANYLSRDQTSSKMEVADSNSNDKNISPPGTGFDSSSITVPASNDLKWETTRPASSISTENSQFRREDVANSDVKSTEVDISSTVAGTDVPSVAASVEEQDWDQENRTARWDIPQSSYMLANGALDGTVTDTSQTIAPTMPPANYQTLSESAWQHPEQNSAEINNMTNAVTATDVEGHPAPPSFEVGEPTYPSQNEFAFAGEQPPQSNVEPNINFSDPRMAAPVYYEQGQESGYAGWDSSGYPAVSVGDPTLSTGQISNEYEIQQNGLPQTDGLNFTDGSFAQPPADPASSPWETGTADAAEYQTYAPAVNEYETAQYAPQPSSFPAPAQNPYWAQMSASVANTQAEQVLDPQTNNYDTRNWSETDQTNILPPPPSNYDNYAPASIPPPTFLPAETQGFSAAPDSTQYSMEAPVQLSNEFQMQPEIAYQDPNISYDPHIGQNEPSNELGVPPPPPPFPEPTQMDPYTVPYPAPAFGSEPPEQDPSTMFDPSIYSSSFSIMDTAASGGNDYRPPHAIISWGFGGTLITVVPRVSSPNDAFGDSDPSTANQNAKVNLFDVASLGGNLANKEWVVAMEAISPLPYPVRPSDLLPYADMCDRLSNLPTTDAMDESRAALWRVLSTLCRNCTSDWRGVMGSAISGPASIPLIGSGFGAHKASHKSPLQIPSMTSTRSEVEQSNAAVEVERLISNGNSDEALHVAKQAELWPLAIILASSLDKQAYTITVTEFAKTCLTDGSALQTLCFAMAENDDEIVRKATSAEGLREWRKTLSTVLASRRSSTEPDNHHSTKHLRIIEKIGDALITQGDDVVAGHVCYLLSGSIESLSNTTIPLLGADESKPAGRPRSLGSPEAVLQSLVYEAIINAKTGSSFPHLLPYRFLLASEIATLGRVDVALAHCESISSSVRAIFESGRNDLASSVLTPPFLACLDSFELRLRGSLGLQEQPQKKGPLSALGRSLSSVFSRTLQAQDDDIPPQYETPQLPATHFSQPSLPEPQPIQPIPQFPPQPILYDSSQQIHSAWQQPNPMQMPVQDPWTAPDNINVTAMSTGMMQQNINLVPSEEKEDTTNKRWNSLVSKTIGVLAPADGDLSPPPRARNDINMMGNIEPTPLGLSPGKGLRTPGQDMSMGHLRSASVGDIPMSGMEGSLDVNTMNQYTNHMNPPPVGMMQPGDQPSGSSDMTRFNGIPVQKVESKPTGGNSLVHKRSVSDITLQSQTSQKKPPRPPLKSSKDENGNEKSPQRSRGWRARLTERIRSAMNLPKQAHMGEDNKFVFNKELGRWVIDGENVEEEDDVPPPPSDQELNSPAPSEDQSSSTYSSVGAQEPSSSSMPRSYSIQESVAPDQTFGDVPPQIPRASSFTPSYPTQAPMENLNFPRTGSESSTASGTAASGTTGPISVASQPLSPGPRTAASNRYRAGSSRLSGRRAYVDTFNKGKPTASPVAPYSRRPAGRIVPGGGASNAQAYKIFTPAPTPSASSDTDTGGGSGTLMGGNPYNTSVVESSNAYRSQPNLM